MHQNLLNIVSTTEKSKDSDQYRTQLKKRKVKEEIMLDKTRISDFGPKKELNFDKLRREGIVYNTFYVKLLFSHNLVLTPLSIALLDKYSVVKHDPMIYKFESINEILDRLSS